MFETLAALGRLMRSPGFKFFLVLFLVLLVSIPVFVASLTVDERASRAIAVRDEVGRLWGPSQRLVGPFVVVPYTVRVSEVDNDKRIERVVERNAVFTPERLEATGRTDAQLLHRSIYDVPVYAAHLRLSGRFGPLRIGDVEPVGVETVRWNDAIFVLALSGVAGLKSEASLKLNGAEEIPFSPSTGLPGDGPEGVHARLSSSPGAAFNPDAPFAFDVALDFNGSTELMLAPVAKQTQFSLESNWSTPSFGGAFLPSERKIDASGFRASWNIPHLARSVPESWSLQASGVDRFAQSAFGVRFVDPVDFYDLVQRATKYALMFVTLAFAAVFCMELISKRRVHPVQYLFTGVALVFFYILLLSFAEHIGFNFAYALAATATGAMLAIYVGMVLSSPVRGAVMAAILATLFGLLYFILRLEDYALLAGGLLGFAALTLTMFATLRVDWSGQRDEIAPPPTKA
jgi:inner membrane protein